MQPQLLVFYDRSCPLCVAEMETLEAADSEARLSLRDCSVADFSHPAAAAAGISQAQMLAALHVLDTQGRWHVGVEAFVQVYRALGIYRVADWLDTPWLRPLLERLYPWVARNRQGLSKLGLNRLFATVVARQARRAAAARCDAESCQRSGTGQEQS